MIRKKKIFTIIKLLPFTVLSPIILIFIYLLRPIFLIRFNQLPSSRIGHFAAETELYCCEKEFNINTPKKPYLDLFFYFDICNEQLAKMWKRKLNIISKNILYPICYLNSFLSKFFPSLKMHSIEVSNEARDIHDLFIKSKPHISFNDEEKQEGLKFLKKFNLSEHSKFVCLFVRDSLYLKKNFNEINNFNYHSYRNGKIDNFILAAEEITKRGYYVFRMGKDVEKPLKSSNPMIIDYSFSDLRSDFLDIYLSANCFFHLSTATGIDNIPFIFRKPAALIHLPLAYTPTYTNKSLFITKHFFSKKKKRKLKFSEISSSELTCALTTDIYKKHDVELIDNSPEEIKDLAIEMIERLNDKWKSNEHDKILQENFWKIFHSSDLNKFNIHTNLKLHGKIRMQFGAKFLRENMEWQS